MSLFTVVLGLAVNNARSILIKNDQDSTTPQGSIISFKQKWCEQLVTPYVRFKNEQEQQKQQQRQNKCKQPNIDDTLGITNNNHMLANLQQMPNKDRLYDAHCYLCLVLGNKLKFRFGCAACGKAYHPVCFTAFHHSHALSNNVKTVAKLALDAAKDNTKLIKRGKYITAISEAEFPFMRNSDSS